MDEFRKKPKVCFISHSSNDKGCLSEVVKSFRSHYREEDFKFFYSSDPYFTTDSSSCLGSSLREALDESDVMIAFITDSYLRSVICIAEISAFWFCEKRIIPIVFGKNGITFFRNHWPDNKRYLDLSDRSKTNIESCATKLIIDFEARGFISEDRDCVKNDLIRIFSNFHPATPVKPYIGSGEIYENINKYCEENGISRITNATLNYDDLKNNIKGCKELFIVATTGDALIKKLYRDFLPSELSKGMKLTMLIPNKWSAYISDVAEIEGTPNRLQGLQNELDSIVNNLKYSQEKAKDICKENRSDCCGEIFLGCSYTLIRQTIILAVWDDRFWGRFSTTIPPNLTSVNTPSLEFSCSRKDNSFGSLIYEHVISIQKMAENRKAFFKLSEQLDFHEFYLENKGAEEHWKKLYETAKQKSSSREGKTELIEVSAQHPLRPNGSPNEEFAKRLDCSISLYQQLQKEGKDVKFFIPGSVHCYQGKPDPCSLSASGKKYLIANGIPEEIILGEEENRKYKGDLGVYNMADECFVASRIFFDGNYHRLHCVCSPNQLLRKKLFYIAFGVIPFYYTVSTEKMAHDDIYELFTSVPNVIMRDNTWQSHDSNDGIRTRKDRDPHYQG